MNMEVINQPTNSVDPALQQANAVALQQANSVDSALQAMATNTGVNLNSLETLIAFRCEIREHVPTTGGMGMFFMRGTKLLPTYNKVLTEKPEIFL